MPGAGTAPGRAAQAEERPPEEASQPPQDRHPKGYTQAQTNATPPPRRAISNLLAEGACPPLNPRRTSTIIPSQPVEAECRRRNPPRRRGRSRAPRSARPSSISSPTPAPTSLPPPPPPPRRPTTL